jgi:hypothetical protein
MEIFRCEAGSLLNPKQLYARLDLHKSEQKANLQN